MTRMVANTVTVWEQRRVVPVRPSSVPHAQLRSEMTIRFTTRENHPDKEAFRGSAQEAQKNNPFWGERDGGERN